MRDQRHPRRPPWIAGIPLGVGLGGIFDGFVFHSILQWHHVPSELEGFAEDTVEGLEQNMRWDGVYIGLFWLVTIFAVTALWRLAHRPDVLWSGQAFVGLVVAGWGGYNFLEEIVSHQLIGLHLVRPGNSLEFWWEVADLVSAAVAMVLGWWLVRRAMRADTDVPTGATGIPVA